MCFFFEKSVNFFKTNLIVYKKYGIHHKKRAISELGKELSADTTAQDDEPILQVIDAFETPRFLYNDETGKYDKVKSEPLLGGIDSKIQGRI